MTDKQDKFILQTQLDELYDISIRMTEPESALDKIIAKQKRHNCSTKEAILLVREDLLVTISKTTDELFNLAADCTE